MSIVRSWETGKIKAIGRQGCLVLCAAIYAIKEQGEKDPTRSRVLAYIRVGKLVIWEALESDVWADEESMRIQFFSWSRDHAANDGYLLYRGRIDHGIWRLSEKGKGLVERFADQCIKLEANVEKIETKLRDKYHMVILSKQFLALLIRIGQKRQAAKVTN